MGRRRWLFWEGGQKASKTKAKEGFSTKSCPCRTVPTLLHSLVTGPWKLKSCSKSSCWVKSAGIKKLKRECDFDSFCLAHSFGNFGTNVMWSWRHYFRAIWWDQRKSCVRDVICLSPLSAAEGMPAFWHAVWECIEGRRAAGNYSWIATGTNQQPIFRQVVQQCQRKKIDKTFKWRFLLHAHNFCYNPHILKRSAFSESRCTSH